MEKKKKKKKKNERKNIHTVIIYQKNIKTVKTNRKSNEYHGRSNINQQ
jgi:hypothetical protein